MTLSGLPWLPGSGTRRLSLIGLNTIVHRPHKMAMEDMVNVCTRYILFHLSVCLFGGFVGLLFCDYTPEAANLVVSVNAVNDTTYDDT